MADVFDKYRDIQSVYKTYQDLAGTLAKNEKAGAVDKDLLKLKDSLVKKIEKLGGDIKDGLEKLKNSDIHKDLREFANRVKEASKDVTTASVVIEVVQKDITEDNYGILMKYVVSLKYSPKQKGATPFSLVIYTAMRMGTAMSMWTRIYTQSETVDVNMAQPDRFYTKFPADLKALMDYVQTGLAKSAPNAENGLTKLFPNGKLVGGVWVVAISKQEELGYKSEFRISSSLDSRITSAFEHLASVCLKHGVEPSGSATFESIDHYDNDGDSDIPTWRFVKGKAVRSSHSEEGTPKGWDYVLGVTVKMPMTLSQAKAKEIKQALDNLADIRVGVRLGRQVYRSSLGALEVLVSV